MLPFLYAQRTRGLYAEYSHHLYRQALNDFIEVLPEGPATYQAAVRRFALDLYTAAAGPGRTHFLDKTPRYHLVAQEVVELFPEGRCVVLFRHPLAVLASIITTWGDGRWITYLYKVDLFRGLANLTRLCREAHDRVHVVRYEDLVGGDDAEWKRLFDHVGLTFDPNLLVAFGSTELKGRMGDKWGSARYRSVSARSLDLWKDTLAGPLRKRWARRYLRWIGRDRLALMGYDLDVLLAELDALPSTGRHLLSDAARMVRGAVHPWVEPTLFRTKRANRSCPDEVVVHT